MSPNPTLDEIDEKIKMIRDAAPEDDEEEDSLWERDEWYWNEEDDA